MIHVSLQMPLHYRESIGYPVYLQPAITLYNIIDDRNVNWNTYQLNFAVRVLLSTQDNATTGSRLYAKYTTTNFARAHSNNRRQARVADASTNFARARTAQSGMVVNVVGVGHISPTGMMVPHLQLNRAYCTTPTA